MKDVTTTRPKRSIAFVKRLSMKQSRSHSRQAIRHRRCRIPTSMMQKAAGEPAEDSRPRASRPDIGND